MQTSKQTIRASLESLHTVTQALLESNNNIFLLSGVVGSGKTTLTQAFLEYYTSTKQSTQDSTSPKSNPTNKSLITSQLETYPIIATSPTFNIMHDYGGIYHYDLYNRSIQNVLELGLLEWLSTEGFHFIEWGESLLTMLHKCGFDCTLVRISCENTTSRIYEIYC